jgi:taurine dioxygenase
MFEISPICSAIAAEIRGLGLHEPLDPETRSVLLATWREHLVLVFRDQHLSPQEVLDLAHSFGVLDPAPAFDNERSDLPGFPEIAVVSNIRENGVAIGGLGSGELAWHSDMTYRQAPPVACILSGVEIPPAGGDTYFLSMAGALDALPADLKRAIAGRSLAHDPSYTSAGTLRQGAAAPLVHHPMIMRDPLSGREVLLLGRRRQSAIDGLSPAESEALLSSVWSHVDSGDFVYTHRWRRGDVVLWANLAIMHRRDPFDDSGRRILHRAQIASLS